MAPLRATALSRPAPFLKWAGGKGRLLPELLRRVPRAFGRYHEPFVGGGALFFALAAERGGLRARLSDRNPELIGAYRAVRDRCEAVIRALAAHKNEPDHYYRVRAVDPATLSPPERAARLIFLNKTCYNGLYRQNRRGLFNVPFGRYANPRLCDADGLRRASRSLRGTVLARDGFETILDEARPGDFVYFDPPYHPVSPTSSFTAYCGGGFDAEAQRHLAAAFLLLARRGVALLLSNSDCAFVRGLYAGCGVETVWARRAINSRAERRGPVAELLVSANL